MTGKDSLSRWYDCKQLFVQSAALLFNNNLSRVIPSLIHNHCHSTTLPLTALHRSTVCLHQVKAVWSDEWVRNKFIQLRLSETYDVPVPVLSLLLGQCLDISLFWFHLCRESDSRTWDAFLDFFFFFLSKSDLAFLYLNFTSDLHCVLSVFTWSRPLIVVFDNLTIW